MASLIQIAMKLVSTFTPPPYSARRSASPVSPASTTPLSSCSPKPSARRVG